MKTLKTLAAAAALATALTGTAKAWDGYDYQTGSYVEISRGNLVRPGKDIEIYDYSTGEYKDVTVESIRGKGFGAEVEVYDYSTGEYRYLDMD